MKKNLLIVSVIVSIFLISAVSAAIQVDTQPAIYTPSKLYPNTYLATGSQLLFPVTVTNTNGINLMKKVQLEWGSSSVGCNRISATSNVGNYNCILTVTPSMDEPEEVFIHAEDRQFSVLESLGTFDFAGTNFPDPQNPPKPTKVFFNGEWVNGITLYSDTIHISNGYIFGKDVSPDRSTITQERVCETTYKQKTRRVCERVVINGRTKRQCHTEYYQVPKTKCKTVKTPTYCLNPNGDYTNSLRLENFKVSFDGGSTWEDIPYKPSRSNGYYKLIVTNEDVKFKVEIPEMCSPEYLIDDAITISPLK